MAFNDTLFSSTNVAGRVGSKLGTGEASALFLKKFAGEVRTVFDEKNIMKPLHTIRTTSKGKSAQFPIIGTAAAGYYTPGTDILSVQTAGDGSKGGLNHFKQTETLIHIDKMLMSSTFIASIDELVSHFDVRSSYSHQLGEALANQFDKNVLNIAIQTGAKNASAALVPSDAFISGQTQRGSVVYSSSASGTATAAQKKDTDFASAAVNGLRAIPVADTIREALFKSARLLDEKDVPSSDRYAIITPAMYYELINNSANTDVVNSVINKDVGGEGSIAAGTVARVAGITLLVSNHIPSTNLTDASNKWSDSGSTPHVGNSYVLNATDVAGLVFQKGGFATLKLQDLTMESEYMITRQGNLFVAKYSMGHGALRPESVVVWSDKARPTG